MMTGIPSPSLNTLPWPNFVDNRGRLYLFRIVLITALKANCPRQRIVFRSLSESISLGRDAEQFGVCSLYGLVLGGADVSAAVTYALFTTCPSSRCGDVG